MVDSNSSNCKFIDTHCHLDGEEFNDDRDDVVQRAREAGCTSIFLPAIDVASCQTVLDTCKHYPDFCYPMLGLHPEEVKADWKEQLSIIHSQLSISECVAIGEVGLDYYWSREFEQEQLLAFEEQVRWSVELQLPLMIHCRKAQNEMVAILKKYVNDLSGGVFHCFTGNGQRAGSPTIVGVRPLCVGYRRCADFQEKSSARSTVCLRPPESYCTGNGCPLHGACSPARPAQ